MARLLPMTLVCVCVFAVHGHSNDAVETKLAMLIEGTKVKATGGLKSIVHVHIAS